MTKKDSLYTPLIDQPIVVDQTRSSWSDFPGRRRTHYAGGPPSSDKLLVKTGGNALQAVPRSTLAENLIAVAVPECLQAGDPLLVQAPDGRVLETAVPEGTFPGHTFLVRVPPPETADLAAAESIEVVQTSNSTTRVVDGHDIEQTDLSLAEEPTATPVTDREDDNLVLVQVPAGARPGDKVRVEKNGQAFEATIPEGNLTEFYVRVPTVRQNWHRNPATVAPMAVGPFLV